MICHSSESRNNLSSLALALPLFFVVFGANGSAGLAQDQKPKLAITVADETGVAVHAAQVTLEKVGAGDTFKTETNHAGRCEIGELSAGVYHVRVQKSGFYAVDVKDVRVGEAPGVKVTLNVEVILNHVQEFSELVDVVESAPTIDPAKTSASEKLASQDIVNLPYPSTRDYRNLLPLIPGVLQDSSGQIHPAGSATYQVQDQLDGFNITHPVTGLLDMRVSVDALRSMQVETSRYSAEHGKGSGGVVRLETGMGDDRYRFSATNFIPSFQTSKGLSVDKWTPRATLSGPLRRGRAWFFEGIDSQYDLNILNELPPDANESSLWRVNSLTKAQINLNSSNILTASFLVNHFQSAHAGLSRFSPLETTTNQQRNTYLFALKNQTYFSNGMLMEIGLGVDQFRNDKRPRGILPYLIRPDGASGNFFETAAANTRRFQGIANLFLPTLQWHGRHEFKLGADVDRIIYHQSFDRQPITILREDGTLLRQSTFNGSGRFGKNNFESSAFAQDRWHLSDRLLAELGIRFDQDQIVRRALLSPRFASTYLLSRSGDTKISAGIGLFYDATNLDFVTRPLAGHRLDRFYSNDGRTPAGPAVETLFLVNERDLRAPRFLNWSLGLERRLPASLFLRAEFLQKRGRNGFTFINKALVQDVRPANVFELQNERRDRYDALELTLRRKFKENHALLASYTRSSARSNAVVDFKIDDPVSGLQSGGPLPWDAPNRFLSWGWLPLVDGFDLAYSAEWRHGYPFSLINEEQKIVGKPNARRFSDYFSLNLHLERRFNLLGYQWALRAGFNDVTNRPNPTVVNNNIDSPRFLTFGGLQHRTFNGRIRFLGRK